MLFFYIYINEYSIMYKKATHSGVAFIPSTQ